MSDLEFDDLVEYSNGKGIDAAKEKINYSEDKIKTLFKAYIGRNILDDKGFYPIYHKIDTVFKRAVYELDNE